MKAETTPGALGSNAGLGGTVGAQALHVLRHSLGLDQYGHGRPYRNHFVTSEHTTDWPHCLALVSEGLMSRFPPSALTGCGDCFVVTAAGRAYVTEHSPKPPKMTRSQLRYETFLAEDSGLPFGDWLRARGVRPNVGGEAGPTAWGRGRTTTTWPGAAPCRWASPRPTG